MFQLGKNIISKLFFATIALEINIKALARNNPAIMNLGMKAIKIKFRRK